MRAQMKETDGDSPFPFCWSTAKCILMGDSNNFRLTIYSNLKKKKKFPRNLC